MLLTGWKYIYYLNVTDCGCFIERKLFALWILFTLSSLSGLFKFDILLVLIGIILYSKFTGLNNIYISKKK